MTRWTQEDGNLIAGAVYAPGRSQGDVRISLEVIDETTKRPKFYATIELGTDHIGWSGWCADPQRAIAKAVAEARVTAASISAAIDRLPRVVPHTQVTKMVEERLGARRAYEARKQQEIAKAKKRLRCKGHPGVPRSRIDYFTRNGVTYCYACKRPVDYGRRK